MKYIRESIGYDEAIDRTKVLIDVVNLYTPSFKRLGIKELHHELKSVMCLIPSCIARLSGRVTLFCPER